MHLRELQLLNFRNYTDNNFAFTAGLNCVVGNNGRGKTNLLDAIYYLCMCKSHFAGSDRSVLRRGGDFIRLVGQFERLKRSERVVAKVIPGKKKEFERNGNAYSRLVEHIGMFPVVFITPDDTQLAREGSEARRKFMDNTLCQTDPKYLAQLIDYNRLLRQRNALLRKYLETGNYSRELLATYNQQMIGPASYLFTQRNLFVGRFSPVFDRFYRDISGGHESVELRYQSKFREAPLSEQYDQTLASDLRRGYTTAGIHRDDLGFRLNGFPVKRFASQGQLKSFVLALKLAQYDYLKSSQSVAPILLLDDIFDKLDADRVGRLLQLLTEQQFGQVFLTDTDRERVVRVIEGLQIEKKIIEVS